MKKHLSREITEDFWHDCINNREAKVMTEFFPYNNHIHYLGRNNKKKRKFKNSQHSSSINKKKNNNHSKNKINNKSFDDQYFTKICKNHPLLEENIQTNKIDKDLENKKKNAMMRCLGLYAYGVEVKKAKILNDENNKKEKIKDEISPCTFRPKISKYSKYKKARFNNPQIYYKKNKKQNINNNILSNGDYKINTSNTNINVNDNDNDAFKNKIKNKKNKRNNNDYKDEDSNDIDEYTFKPKINKKKLKYVFGKSNSLANEKDNAEFILRYTKAREEYMIKKLKKMSVKDDSYDLTLLTLAHRLNNKHYKNGSMETYDIKFRKNSRKGNLSMSDDKDYFVNNKKSLSIEKNIINHLRNDLLEINLNEDE